MGLSSKNSMSWAGEQDVCFEMSVHESFVEFDNPRNGEPHLSCLDYMQDNRPCVLGQHISLSIWRMEVGVVRIWNETVEAAQR